MSITAKISNIHFYNENLFELAIDKKLNFIPGQHFSLSIDSIAINREYSSFSAPGMDNCKFLIRKIKDGILSQNLSNLEIGNEIIVHGPYGSFRYNEENSFNKHVFISTGTGIAPFISMIVHFKIDNYLILNGVREAKDIIFFEQLDKSKTINFVSREDKLIIDKNLQKGRVTDYLTNDLSREIYSKNFNYYLCGNSSMIDDVYDILLERDVDPNKIFVESYF